MYKVIRRNGKPIMEQFENENVIITKFLLTGETETKFKPNCDPKVKEIYKKLHACGTLTNEPKRSKNEKLQRV